MGFLTDDHKEDPLAHLAGVEMAAFPGIEFHNACGSIKQAAVLDVGSNYWNHTESYA